MTKTCILLCLSVLSYANAAKLSDQRVVLQTKAGDIEFGFYPEAAPVTSAHIFTLVQLGLYTTNEFFRLDKGFVAQVQDVSFGRQLPLNAQQQEHAKKTVPLEVQAGIVHRAGVLSMGRYADSNSGSSSFSILLNDAPHLDMQYTIFGEVTRGMEVIDRLLEQPMKREGIFVMPKERVTIMNSYWYTGQGGPPQQSLTLKQGATSSGSCEQELQELKERFANQAQQVEGMRRKMLP